MQPFWGPARRKPLADTGKRLKSLGVRSLALGHVNPAGGSNVEQGTEAVVTFEEATTASASSLTFEEVFPVLIRDAYRVAYRLLGDRSEAEDVAQEACARTYSRWSSVRDHAEPWCVRVASNLALDVLRARTRAVKRNERLRPTVQTAASAVDDRLDLYAALERLPRRQRETVVLRYLGDLSEAQTADLIGVSVGSVKTHASRGLAALKEVITR
jgi:RNA polymerase sigma-70 factor (sigma-E family)